MARKVLGDVQGKSAYEVWLAQGNTGSEQDFLNSLKGEGADLSNYYNKQEVDNLIDNVEVDLTGYAKEEDIPTKVSELTNDSKFATETFVTNKIAEAELSGGDVDLTGYATKDDLLNKVDKEAGKSLVADTEILRLSTVNNYDDTEIKQDITDINQALNKKAEKTDIPTVPTKVSELTNDSGFTTTTDLDDYIEENKDELKGADGVSPTASVNKVGNITTLTVVDGNGTTTSNIYDGENGIDGTTPVKGVDYWTESDKEEIQNDSHNFITEKLASLGQARPIYVNSIEECTDSSTLYVLPDGYIYAYMHFVVEGGEPLFTNLANPSDSTWKNNYRFNASAVAATASGSVNTGSFVSNTIPCKKGDILRIKNVRATTGTSGTDTQFAVVLYDASGAKLNAQPILFVDVGGGFSVTASVQAWNAVNITDDGVYEWEIAKNNAGSQIASGIASLQICGITTTGDVNDVIITVGDSTNGKIEYSKDEEGYRWQSTGIMYVQGDNDDRVTLLENDMVQVKSDIEDLKENGVGTTVKRDVNWYAFGDSITEGYVSYVKDETLSYPSSGSSKLALSLKQSWVYKVAELNGFNVTNKAVGGTGYAYGNPNATSNARIQVDAVDFTDVDLVTFAWGCNDWKYNGGPIGSKDDDKDTGTTPCASLKWCIERVLSQNPLCKIIVITPINVAFWGTFEGNYGLTHSFSKTGTLEEFYQAIVGVCEYYGIEYIDMTHSSVYNRANLTKLLLDGVHPTPEAYVAMGTELAKKINF